MASTIYGSTNAKITISSTISGSGTSVAADGSITYCLAKEVDLGIDFDSKIVTNANHRSRVTPDVKFKQGFNVQNAILVGADDVNSTTEWIIDAYIAKTPIYAIVKLPPPTGSTYVRKSWYNGSNSKVYYLRGVLGKLKIKLKNGRLHWISFDFREAWGT